MTTEGGFFYRKFWAPLLGQLKQGTSPDKLAWSVAVGFTISVFPILGATTPLGLLAGIVFRLNHVVLQVGESVFGLPHISFNPVRLTNEFTTAPKLFLLTYGASGLAGIAIWAVLAPFTMVLVKTLFLPILRRKSLEPAP
jgi:hypothetical protein